MLHGSWVNGSPATRRELQRLLTLVAVSDEEREAQGVGVPELSCLGGHRAGVGIFEEHWGEQMKNVGLRC